MEAVAEAAPKGAVVTREQLLAALARVAPRLAEDPMFRDEACAPFDAAELERYFSQPQSTTIEELFGETLQGMIQSVRYAGLHVVREAVGTVHAVSDARTKLIVAQDEAIAVVGDLRVGGDLVLDGVLVVTGDLTVAGALIGPPFSYSLAAVGGTLRARDVTSAGEILVGQALIAERVVHLVYNDYSSILPRLEAKLLVLDDNTPALGDVTVEQRLDGRPDEAQLRALFGPTADVADRDDGRSPLRRLIGAED